MKSQPRTSVPREGGQGDLLLVQGGTAVPGAGSKSQAGGKQLLLPSNGSPETTRPGVGGAAPQHFVDPGQMFLLRHLLQRGRTGKQICCPKPTRSQFNSLQRVLQAAEQGEERKRFSVVEKVTQHRYPAMPEAAAHPQMLQEDNSQPVRPRGLQHQEITTILEHQAIEASWYPTLGTLKGSEIATTPHLSKCKHRGCSRPHQDSSLCPGLEEAF